MPRNRKVDERLAKNLDSKYHAYLMARSDALSALRKLFLTVYSLGRAVAGTRSMVRPYPFANWCRVYCKIFEQSKAQAIESVVNRMHVPGIIETWQLRLLGLTTTIHHAKKPLSTRRKVKSISWLTYISRTREEIVKMIERAGGVDKMTNNERSVIKRQLDSLDDLKKKVS